jgi:hypothetical protein
MSTQGASITSRKTPRLYPGRKVRFAMTLFCTFILNQVYVFHIVGLTGSIGGALEYQVSLTLPRASYFY